MPRKAVSLRNKKTTIELARAARVIDYANAEIRAQAKRNKPRTNQDLDDLLEMLTLIKSESVELKQRIAALEKRA